MNDSMCGEAAIDMVGKIRNGMTVCRNIVRIICKPKDPYFIASYMECEG